MKHCSVAIVLVTLLISQVTFAGARQHFMAGKDYYSQGRYEKAIEEFQEAYRLDPKSLLLYNISQAYEKAGDLKKSLDYLSRFLEAEPDTDDRPTLEAKISMLKERIASTGIIVSSNESGAAIYVNDEQVGTTPVKGVVSLAIGAHRIRVSKPGFKDFEMKIAVSPGISVPIDVNLEPGLAKPPPKASSPQEEVKEPIDETDEGIEALDVVPWVIAGVGGAMAIVGLGVIGGLANSSQPSDGDADPKAQNEAHDKAVIADAIGWPGVALAAGGAIWGIVRIATKESDNKKSSSSFVPFVDEHRAGVFVSMSF